MTKKLWLDITLFVFLMLYLISPVQGVTTQGLVGYWKFDGNSEDISGYEHDGTLHNSPGYVTGQVDQCLHFNGSNDYVTLDNRDSRLTISNAITITAWIKGDNFASGYRHIYDKNGSHTLSVYNGKVAARDVGGWWKPNTTPLQTGRWYHVAWTDDGSHKRIYINGEVKANTFASGTFSPGGTICISHSGYPFDGLIDEVKLYNRALTAVEIKSSYYEELALVGYWPLDGNAQDHSGYHHDGSEHGEAGYEGSLVSLALSLDGKNDYISISNRDGTLTLKKEVTIEAWIRGDAFGSSYRHIYNHSGSHTLSVYNDQLAMSCAGGWWKPNTARLKIGQWYHVVGTYDGSLKKLYINGKEAARASQTGNMSPGSGVGISHHLYQFCGLIDEVKVYNKALPAEVIEQHYEEVPKPVGIWSFDHNANDKSGWRHEGTLFFGPGYVDGKINQCLDLDGSNDYVLISNREDRLTFRHTLTIEAWIKGNHFGRGYHHIYDKFSSHTLSVKNGKLAISGLGGWWWPSSTTLKPQQWYHVVGTFDGSEKRLYINGVLKASTSQKGTLRPGYDVYISHYYHTFDGLIDEVKVYDRALSAREVWVRYNPGRQ